MQASVHRVLRGPSLWPVEPPPGFSYSLQTSKAGDHYQEIGTPKAHYLLEYFILDCSLLEGSFQCPVYV